MKSQSITAYIVIGSLVIGFIFYYLYNSGNKTAKNAPANSTSATLDTRNPDGTLVNSANNANSNIGAEVISLLNRINSLRIDPSVFSDQAYLSLVDFGREIPSDNVGRVNPFAPIQGFAVPVAPAPASSPRR